MYSLVKLIPDFSFRRMSDADFALMSRVMNEVLNRHPVTPDSWCTAPAYLKALDITRSAVDKAENMITSIIGGSLPSVRTGFIILRLLVSMEIRLCLKTMNHCADGGCDDGCSIHCFLGLVSLKPLIVTTVNCIMWSLIKERPEPSW